VNPAVDPAQLSRIEDAGINASAPPQQRWVDGWLVRYSPGKAKRARCINPVAAGRMPLEAKLAICRRLYEEVGLPVMVRVTPFSQPEGIDGQLAALGFERLEETCVMVSRRWSDSLSLPLPVGYRIEALSQPDLAETVGLFRGTPLAQREAHAERLQKSPVPFGAFAVLDRNGIAVACGQYALEDDLAGIYDVFTAEHERASGLASALCRHLLDVATTRGARIAYLQVEQTNSSAQRIYERLGFETAYAYHYRAAPTSAPT